MAPLAGAVLLTVATLGGCNRHDDKPDLTGVVPTVPDGKENKEAVDPRWQQSWADATRKEPLADWDPPVTTLSGKSVGKVYTEVRKLWDSSRLTSEDGKRLAHKAVLETDLGTVEITLRTDWAPNHVRNFLSLIRAGYYDGLVFERIHKEQSDTQPGEKLEMVEGGCPLGTGDFGSGSIGYWLKPEFNAQVAHEAGTVGALHEEEEDTAACRFYITLGKAPLLDGHFTAFGKVTQGLDVARKIFEQPVQQAEGAAEGSLKPVKPVVIKKVTLVTTEVEAGDMAKAAAQP